MIEEFQTGKTIVVDKPYGWTSFDVVNKIRWNIRQALGVKKIKVGHAGTLDPLASGLLVICSGKHTKRIPELMEGIKTYTGTILLGKTTPSYDLETAFNEEFATAHITAELIEQVRVQFLGEQEQIPPVYSAKQIDGKRAYDYAREGKEVVMKSVTIRVDDFQLSADKFPEIEFELTCTKGTYIRSIAHDFGKALNSGATLIALRRTRSGQHSIEDARSVDEWISEIRGISK
jgi:tRNA pseudouridine55 synthase